VSTVFDCVQACISSSSHSRSCSWAAAAAPTPPTRRQRRRVTATPATRVRRRATHSARAASRICCWSAILVLANRSSCTLLSVCCSARCVERFVGAARDRAFAAKIAPRAVRASGVGVTGAGLTVAAVRDQVWHRCARDVACVRVRVTHTPGWRVHARSWRVSAGRWVRVLGVPGACLCTTSHAVVAQWCVLHRRVRCDQSGRLRCHTRGVSRYDHV
jgi:hypothetical protein